MLNPYEKEKQRIYQHQEDAQEHFDKVLDTTPVWWIRMELTIGGLWSVSWNEKVRK